MASIAYPEPFTKIPVRDIPHKLGHLTEKQLHQFYTEVRTTVRVRVRVTPINVFVRLSQIKPIEQLCLPVYSEYGVARSYLHVLCTVSFRPLTRIIYT